MLRELGLILTSILMLVPTERKIKTYLIYHDLLISKRVISISFPFAVTPCVYLNYREAKVQGTTCISIGR